MKVVRQPIRTLDFDVESRPLNFLGSDYTNDEVTITAWKWVGEPGDVEVRALTSDQRSRVRMLKAFRKVYEAADLVVGHNIRRFDLPLMSGMCVEADLGPLPAKLTSDTLLDLPKLGTAVSKSQKNLSDLLGVTVEKVDMSAPAWREANRLTKDGVARAKDRAAFDVLQNIELRSVLIAKGLLAAPKVWRP